MSFPVGRIDSGSSVSSGGEVRSEPGRDNDTRLKQALFRPDTYAGTVSSPAEADARVKPDAPKVEMVAMRGRSSRAASYSEPFYEPPTSVDAARPTVRGNDRLEAFQGRTRERALANLEAGRKSVDAHAAPLQKALNDRADSVAATNPELAGRLRQSARDLPHATLGMLGIESNFGTGMMLKPQDGPLQVNPVAQVETAAQLKNVDPSLRGVNRATVPGGVQAAMAHLTGKLMQDKFDGDLRRAISQFNGGNADGMAFTRHGQQNGYVAAAYDLGRRLQDIPRP